MKQITLKEVKALTPYIVENIKKIEDINERSVIFSQIFWNYFGQFSRKQLDKSIFELKDSLPYPKDEVPQSRIDDLYEEHLMEILMLDGVKINDVCKAYEGAANPDEIENRGGEWDDRQRSERDKYAGVFYNQTSASGWLGDGGYD